ncbi:MAG: 1-acyl-sn-glycerol-3-phosphate acyltransferase [Deltaproteobacteria bacterium]|nr:1-acyl-sn-glycerol-3-phosphate acyltransferase [Deltaproteobacteria bacterium]MBI4223452.1 1-acyl-sn-glycerol-3-phosphate acyltransferase [Deltaproteobacteria bacterium]
MNRWAGRLELHWGWLRDWFFIVVSLWILGGRIAGWVEWGFLWDWPAEVVFLGLALYSRWWRWHALAVLQEFARLNPRVHPSEFFEHLHGRLGFLPHRVPAKAARLVDPDRLDFRTGKKPGQSLWLLLRGVYDTFLFATLAYKAFRWKGAKYIGAIGSGLSMVWAARVAQLARMKVSVERTPSLEEAKQAKIIYVLNHTSFFDFCLAPLAYRRENKDGSAKSFTPSIMVAKDHFKDNFFLYRVIGLGRMLEAWGMIFVDRKSKEKGTAERAVRLTVKKLLASSIPFAVYPQGTRARGQRDRYGRRWDAGYFCVGKRDRLNKEEGHFKKGAAYVAVELAAGLVKHRLGGKVFVVPVAMAGPGTACPKGSWKVQTETEVLIKMGEPMPVDSQMKAPDLAQAMDTALQNLLEVRTRLERRFFTDLRELLEPQALEEVSVAFKEWRGRGNLLYAVIDCLYALPKRRWRPLLLELSHALRQENSKEELTKLKEKVANYF